MPAEGLQAATLAPVEYGARMLAAFCKAALVNASAGRARFVAYESLPDAFFTNVLPLFGVAPAEDELQRTRDIVTVDAKSERSAFKPAANLHPSPEIDRLSAEWLDPVYASLRAHPQARAESD